MTDRGHHLKRALKHLLWISAVAFLAFPLLKGSISQVPSGTWQAAGNMAEAREGSSSALLPDGRVLISGGAGTDGPLASADLFSGVSVDAFVSTTLGRNHGQELGGNLGVKARF